LAYLLVLPGSWARIVRCGGRYDPQLVKRSSEWVSDSESLIWLFCWYSDTLTLQIKYRPIWWQYICSCCVSVWCVDYHLVPVSAVCLVLYRYPHAGSLRGGKCSVANCCVCYPTSEQAVYWCIINGGLMSSEAAVKGYHWAVQWRQISMSDLKSLAKRI